MCSVDDILTTGGLYPERATFADAKITANATEMAKRVTMLLQSFSGTAPHGAKQRALTSGFRPDAVNAATPGAAKGSLHKLALAADIEDDDRELAVYCLSDQKLLEHIGLWLENPQHTKKRRADGSWARWVHVQMRPPASGKRVFDPGSTVPR
jgi:hypothetical protein